MTLERFKIEVFPLKNKLYRLAKRFLEDHEDAQDIIQEVFIKLWNRKDKLEEYRSVEALAMVTTRNLCLDKLKARKFTIEKIENIQEQVDEDDTEISNEQNEMVRRIHKVIKTLPEAQQTIIHLRDIEGYEFDEIGKILGMNQNAIRVNLSRARKKVRELIVNEKKYEFHRN